MWILSTPLIPRKFVKKSKLEQVYFEDVDNGIDEVLLGVDALPYVVTNSLHKAKKTSCSAFGRMITGPFPWYVRHPS